MNDNGVIQRDPYSTGELYISTSLGYELSTEYFSEEDNEWGYLLNFNDETTTYWSDEGCWLMSGINMTSVRTLLWYYRDEYLWDEEEYYASFIEDWEA